MPDEPPVEKLFNSTFPMKVDDKRRVQIPAKWRPEEPGVELTVVEWKTSRGPCLRVLPPKRFAMLIDEIEAMPKGSPERDELMREVGSKSEQVTIDSAGRIMLPEAKARAVGISFPDEAARAAGATAEVVLVGVLRVFEIWSTEKFGASSTDSQLGPGAYRLIS
jgi:MraZ protein